MCRDMGLERGYIGYMKGDIGTEFRVWGRGLQGSHLRFQSQGWVRQADTEKRRQVSK